MVRVCLQCGDTGFSNALNECVKCQSYFIHSYCLDKLPEKLDEFVHWVCDLCEVGLVKKLPSSKTKPVQYEGTGHTSSNEDDGQFIIEEERRVRLKQKKKSVSLLGLEGDQRLVSSSSHPPEDAELAISSPVSTRLEKKKCSSSSPHFERRNRTSSEEDDGHLTILQEERRVRSRPKKKNVSLFGREGDQRLESRPSHPPEDAELAISSRSLISTRLEKKECSSLSTKLKDHRVLLVDASTDHEPMKNSNGLDISSKDIEGKEAFVASEGKKGRILQHSVSPFEEVRGAVLATSSLSTDSRKNKASCSATMLEDHRLQPGDTNRRQELTEQSNIECDLSSRHIELTSDAPLSTEFKSSVGSWSAAEVDHRFHPAEQNTEIEVADKNNHADEGRSNTSSKDFEEQQMVVGSKGRKRRRRRRGRRRRWNSHVEQDQDAASATNSELSTELKNKEAFCPAGKVEDHELSLSEKHKKRRMEVEFSSPNFPENGGKECPAGRVDDHELSSSDKNKKKRMEVEFSSPNLPENGGKECQQASQLASVHFEKNLTVDNREKAVPCVEPIWRGDFVILNKDYEGFDDGLVAHLSSKACQKVYEEATLLPSPLDLEMLAKTDCWPKSFQKSQPTDENIALYFFPLDKRSEGLFDYLVEEMMDQELVLKAVLRNAELLVFTSKELPLSHWRFQGKYYLWGVFRGQQAPLPKRQQPMMVSRRES